MKIAYLILAHQAPDHLGRLVRALQAPGVQFHIHVDRRAALGTFRQATPAYANNMSEKTRVAVNWCGFSMVKATMRLLSDAQAAGADRFVLLSGADYPIASNGNIRDRLEGNREWIQVDRSLSPIGKTHFDRCANQPFFGDTPLLSLREGIWPASRLARLVERRLPRRLHARPVFYGPSWWVLSRSAVDYILGDDDGQRDLIEGFRLSRSPDEMVFQTLIKASPRRAKIAFDATRWAFQPIPRRAALHYVDWENPNPNAPRVLDNDDSVERMIASGALFARKFDPLRSATILDRIDAARA